MNATILFLAIYLAILGYIVWSSTSNTTQADFLNSSKKLTASETTWTTFASLLTGYNFVLGVTFSYLYGLYYLFAFIGAALAFVSLYYLYKKRLSPLQAEHNLFSPGDYFELRFGKSTRVITNLILVAALFLFLVLQLFVNTQLFAGLLDVSNITALVITTGFVCIYLYFGGFKTSVKTDILQGLLLLPIVLCVFMMPSYFTVEAIPLALPEGALWLGIGLAGVQFLSLIAQAESFQRVFAAGSTEALKAGLIRSFCLTALVAGAIAYLGINFLLSGAEVNPETLFVDGVHMALPVWLSSLLTISLIGAFMGTIDSSAFALATTVAKSVSRIRFSIVVSIVLAALASLYLFSFLSSVFALISVISVIGVVVLLSLISSIQTFEANTALVVGLVTFAAGSMLGFISADPLTTLIPAGAGAVSALVVRVLRTRKA